MQKQHVTSLESRRLFTFIQADPGFVGGSFELPGTATFSSQINLLEDGGAVAWNRAAALTRIDAQGALVSSFGTNGTYTVPPDPQYPDKPAAIDSLTVDPNTGAIAFVRSVFLEQDELGNYNYKRTLMVGNPTTGQISPAVADVQAYVDQEQSGPYSIAMDSQGRLLVTNGYTVKRLAVGGQSIDLSVNLFVDPVNSIGLLGAGELWADVDDGFMVVPIETEIVGSTVHQRLTIKRYRSDGTLRTTFNGTGELTFEQGSGPLGNFGDPVYVTSHAVAPDGSILLLQVHQLKDQRGVLNVWQVQRIAANGTVLPIITVPSEVGVPTGSLLVSDDAAYIVGGSVIKFDPQTGAFDAAFNGEGGASFGNGAAVTSAVLDSTGQLRVVSAQVGSETSTSTRYRTLSVTGSAVAGSGVSGKSRLRTDGTLDVYGTAGADVIDVRAKNGRIDIIVNSITRRFSQSQVTSINVRAGDGNDRVNIYSRVRGAVVFGQAGNDTLTGSANPDAIFGGDGADSILGRDGTDSLYGGSGNDTLMGGTNQDYLFGAAGVDLLFARDDLTSIEQALYETLLGGAGADQIHRAVNTNSPTTHFDVLDDDQADVLT